MASRRPDRPPDVSVEFGAGRDAPRQARGAVQLLVAGRCDPIADVVRLVASELAANVVQHTRTRRGMLRAWNARPDAPFRLEVEDEDPASPQLVAPTHDEATGRGLHLVAGLSDDWGVEPTTRGGKIVWAEWDRTSSR